MSSIEKKYTITPEEGCIFDGIDRIQIYSTQRAVFILNFPQDDIKPGGAGGLIKFNIQFADDFKNQHNIGCDLVVNGVLLDLRTPFLNNNEEIIAITPVHEGRLHIGLTFNFLDKNQQELPTPITISNIQYSSLIDSPNNDTNRVIQSGYNIAVDQGLMGESLIKKNRGIFELIMDALDKNQPLSIIRLGDGEGRILGHPVFFSEIDVLHQVLLYQFGLSSIESARSLLGNDWLSRSIFELRGMLVHSMQTADVIGLPITQFYDGHKNHPSFGHLGYASAALAYSGMGSQKLVTDRIVGVNVFQYLAAESDCIERILSKANTVYIVGPWDLTDALKVRFSLSDVKYIDVTPHATWGSLVGEGAFPKLYFQTLEKIEAITIESNSLFLIGAGLLGKYYCSVVKSKGGVALDVGALFDSWADKGLPYAIQNEVKKIV